MFLYGCNSRPKGYQKDWNVSSKLDDSRSLKTREKSSGVTFEGRENKDLI